MAIRVLVVEHSGARAALKRSHQPLRVPQGRVHEKQEQDRDLTKTGSCQARWFQLVSIHYHHFRT